MEETVEVIKEEKKPEVTYIIVDIEINKSPRTVIVVPDESLEALEQLTRWQAGNNRLVAYTNSVYGNNNDVLVNGKEIYAKGLGLISTISNITFKTLESVSTGW